MGISRRQFLRLSGLVAASTALAGCIPVYAGIATQLNPASGWLPARPGALPGLHPLLQRLTFGASIQEWQRVAEIGIQAWIEEQLGPELLDDTAASLRYRHLETLSMSETELVDSSDKIFDDQDRLTVPRELRHATLLRQVYSRRQVYETLVDFWSDHFNISTDKGECWYLKTVDDREVIRPNALGQFADLVMASAHSPAMLVYLDNQSNHRGAPNENYARELMELHTLGVQGGYTQNDVMELARCLTGWTVKEHFWRGEFTFDPEQHDDGAKKIMGKSISPSGVQEAETVIQQLATHPATAHFIAFKLARRLIADTPPPQLVAQTASAFLDSKGDIRSTLRTLLFNGLEHLRPKYRRPAQFVVSGLRLLEAETDGGESIQDYLARMGQIAFGWPTPDGYPDRAEAWQGNLLPRWQFGMALARGEIPGTKIDLQNLLQRSGASTPQATLDQLAGVLLGSPLPLAESARLLQSLEAEDAVPEEIPAIIVAGLMASPAYQWI